MKKLLAVCLVVMMVVSCGAISAFARTDISAAIALGNTEVAVGTTTATVKVTLSSDTYPLYICGLDSFINIPEGLALTAVGDMPGTTNAYDDAQSNKGTGHFAIVDPDGGYGDSGAPFISEATDIELTFTIANPSVAAVYDITWDTENTNAYDEDFDYIALSFTNGSVTVKAAGPSVKTITPAATTDLTTDKYADGTLTDVQIGSAVGMKFTQPENVTFTKMIWAITTDAGKKYSRAVDLELKDVTGEVALGATFINGSHANADMGITTEVAPLTITAVNAIFTDGTDNYFTDAADEANQK